MSKKIDRVKLNRIFIFDSYSDYAEFDNENNTSLGGYFYTGDIIRIRDQPTSFWVYALTGRDEWNGIKLKDYEDGFMTVRHHIDMLFERGIVGLKPEWIERNQIAMRVRIVSEEYAMDPPTVRTINKLYQLIESYGAF